MSLNRYIRWWLSNIFRAAALGLFVLLLVPTVAFASGSVNVGFVPSIQTWALILGGVTPLFTYVLNHFAPWASEHAKALALAVVSGVVGAVWAAIETKVFGWNDATVQLVLTSILGAFGVHALVWKPSGINQLLGGGSNATPV